MRLLIPMLLVWTPWLLAQDPPAELLCVAESSGWQATGRHADVLAFIKRLAQRSPRVRVAEMGQSSEGRSLPLIILADPPLRTPAAARQSGKLVVYAQGGIHAGECCGKEALQMLAREIALQPHHPLLKHLVLLFAPIYNPDGNERMARGNRPGQNGPKKGMGQRATAEGYDLNRDNTKLDSPEARALARLLNTWDPKLVIDTHTTDGSYHQNTLTFDGPVNPAGDEDIISFVRQEFLPAVSSAVQQESGYLTTWYGNSNRKKTRWTTYEGRPRFGTRERGIRGIVSILTEAYKYASYKDRILCTRSFVKQLLMYASEHRVAFQQLIKKVRSRALARGQDPRPDDQVALRAAVARLPRDITIQGWVEKLPEGATGRRARPQPTTQKATYKMEHWGAYAATLTVQRPFAYVYPAALTQLTEKLRQHGIPVQAASKSVPVEMEIYKLRSIQHARRPFQKHILLTLDVVARREQRPIQKGAMVVRTGQPLGNLTVYLLEPQSEDGLAAWNLLDDMLKEGQDFPITRVLKPFH